MASDQWSRAKHLLNALLDDDPADSDAWLEERCDDPALRAEVKSLCSAYENGILNEASLRQVLGNHGRTSNGPERSTNGMPPIAGAQIDRYKLTEEIGVGGMSVVYRAERVGSGFEQTVAVKLLQRRLRAGAAEQRFRAERQVLASLDHPNIAGLIDGGVTEGGRPFLVMEYVDGVPIVEYADRNGLDLEARLELFEQVFDAVQAAHRKLVVHRDLKPSNVLVAETQSGPQATLLDFGIAKLLDDSLPVTRPVTRTGHHPLTPSYAAPEQVTGAEATTATDVYQVGVLAYEVLTGTRPFNLENKSAREIERIITETTPPPPSDQPNDPYVSGAELRGDLDVILQKAMRKEPERRYPSVDALAADFRRYRHGKPVEARPATLAYRTRKFVKRHRWGVGVSVAFLLMIVISAAILIRQRAIAEKQRNRAQAEATTATQVSNFLVELFEANHPAQADEPLTARDLLRRGRDRVEELEGQPAVQGRMLDAMGRAHQGLGNYDTADSLLQRALTVQRQSPEADPHTEANILSHLGDLRGNQYEWKNALARYREARSLLQSRSRSLTGSRRILQAELFSDLSRAFRNTNQQDSAEAFIRKALSIRQAVQGANHPAVWDEKATLAYVLRHRGSPDEAKRIYREVLRWQREHADSLDVAETLNNLGYLLRSQGQLERAERRYRASLRINATELGPAHPRVLMIRGNNIAALLQAQGRFAAAEALFRKQLRIVREHYPENHWRYGKWASSLGTVLLYRNRDLAEAESLLRTAKQIYEASDARDRASTLKVQATLGRCLVMRNRDRRAKPLLEETHRALSSDSITAKLDLAHAQVGLGIYHVRRGHYARAESLLGNAHSTFEWAFNDFPGVNENRKPVRQVQKVLARLYERWGKPKKAEAYRQKATPPASAVAEVEQG